MALLNSIFICQLKQFKLKILVTQDEGTELDGRNFTLSDPYHRNECHVYTSLENRIDGSSTWLRWTLMESPVNLLRSWEYATVERSTATV